MVYFCMISNKLALTLKVSLQLSFNQKRIVKCLCLECSYLVNVHVELFIRNDSKPQFHDDIDNILDSFDPLD